MIEWLYTKVKPTAIGYKLSNPEEFGSLYFIHLNIISSKYRSIKTS